VRLGQLVRVARSLLAVEAARLFVAQVGFWAARDVLRIGLVLANLKAS
jgi:hypothetical protein